MARRVLLFASRLGLGLLVLAGCRGDQGPTQVPAKPAVVHNVARPVGPAASVVVESAPVPKPPLEITPGSSTITADDAGLQLLAARKEAGSVRDLTRDVNWSIEPPGLADIEQGGYLRPVAAGDAVVIAAYAGQTASAKIKLEPRSSRPWDFGHDIMPVLSRLGCNTGGCHGRAAGQNGFHLSIFGYDADGDFLALARDAGQRRLSRLAPKDSLFLAKATGRVAHGGGPRLKIGSPEYETLLKWVGDGAPQTSGKGHGALVKVTVDPRSAVMAEPGPLQFRVVAHFADGHERDVTRMASYKVNDDSAASATPDGRVKLLRRAETDLIVRYQSHVVATRLSTVINPGLSFDFSKLKRRNFIDDELFKRLESLRVPPSPTASDAAFLRRASLDLTGEAPSPDEVRRFLADTDADKRIKLIDALIKTDEFVKFWRIKLGDLLQISSARQGNGAYRYQAWIDNALSKNRPWDDVVKTLLTALGDPYDLEKGGPINYALDAPAANVQAELTAQRFLGLRLRCAQCHDHPFDVWTQDSYYGLASFFAKVQVGGGGPGGQMMGKTMITINPAGKVVHLRTQKPVEPTLLDGKVVKVAAKDDARKALAEWMIAPDNPYFSRATANWVWAQLFSKGLVDPPDDMSRANPPVHPDLLDALAKHFVAKKFDLRDLIRTIATSETYGLSAGTVAGNEKDMRLFSHHLPRPLTAHQMADALAQATDVPNRYPGVNPTRRAIEVPDPSSASSILDTFGRCSRAVSCGTVSTPALTLRQALLLIGGDVIESKVSSLNGYMASALKLELEPEELVENLYFRTVCRPPTAEELSHWSAELKKASSRSEAAEDLFWALLNSREFAFNH
jgi:Protein of unknown function (DUF1553)/Protein of unknown function (DUF1549)